MKVRALSWLTALALAALVAGCSDEAQSLPPDVDTDGDGLTDKEEAVLGTDPSMADSDEDGLDDGVENESGTDPLLADTDGDGYTDSQETDAGSDPTDPNDVIYTGGWPYNSNKDDIQDPGWDSVAALGALLPHYQALDQFGEVVDLYDFIGRPVVLDLGTKWCVPCKGMAAWLSTGDTSNVESYAWWKDEYVAIRDMVQNGEIYWVTILFSTSEQAGPAQSSDCTEWEEAYPNEHIAVLADTELSLYDYIDVQSYPAMSVLDKDLKFMAYSNSGPFKALKALSEL